MAAGAFAVLFMIAAGIAWWGNELRRKANRDFEEWKGLALELSKNQQDASYTLEYADQAAKEMIVLRKQLIADENEVEAAKKEVAAAKKEVEAAKKEVEAAKQEALDKLRAMGSQ